MFDYDFENPTLDPDGPRKDVDYSFGLPDSIMDPPLQVQQQLYTFGDRNRGLRDYLNRAELESQNLVDSF